jgi:hypothetical protein
VRHRFFRVAAVLAAVGIPVALVTTHMKPVHYFQRQYAMRTNGASVISGVTATSAGAVPTHEAPNAVDRSDDTFWATRTTPPVVLTLHLSHPTSITGIRVLPGIKGQPARAGQPIPTELELVANDKKKTVHLKDDGKPETHYFVTDLPSAPEVQVIIGQIPGAGAHDLLAISTIQLLHY